MTVPSIRVGELARHMRQRSRIVTVPLREVELLSEGDAAGVLRVGDERLPWGARNTQRVATFLKGPGWKYYEREPLDWQRTVIAHHTSKNPDVLVDWYIEDNSIAGAYLQGAKVIPLADVAERILQVFHPNDTAYVLYDTDQVEVSVVSDLRTIEVPGIAGEPSRPLAGSLERNGIRVGDISSGGVRIVIQPGKPERAPIVEEFWQRYVCTNGMTRRVTGSQINLRGRTVDEILDEMENIMRVIWAGLEASGQNILHSAEIPVPGAVSDFIRVVARERGINPATIMALQERTASLPENPTIYDVTQIITGLANEENIPVLTRRNLQAIGGDLTDSDRATHRCGRCERPLVAA